MHTIAPPDCRACGRRVGGRTWPRRPTYDPITHTYLCRACRPRRPDGSYGGGVALTVDTLLDVISRLSSTEQAELRQRIPRPSLATRIRARFPTLSRRTIRALARAYHAQDRDADDAGLAAILAATDTELLALRNVGPGGLAEFRMAWPKPTTRALVALDATADNAAR